jgi:hypothetical protein
MCMKCDPKPTLVACRVSYVAWDVAIHMGEMTGVGVAGWVWDSVESSLRHGRGQAARADLRIG